MRFLVLCALIHIISLHSMNNSCVITDSGNQDKYFENIFVTYFNPFFKNIGKDIKKNLAEERYKELQCKIQQKNFYNHLNTIGECYKFIDFTYRYQKEEPLCHHGIALVLSLILPAAERIFTQQEALRKKIFTSDYKHLKMDKVNLNYSFYEEYGEDTIKTSYLLEKAAIEGYSDQFKWLLAHGADPNRCILSLFLFGQSFVLQELKQYCKILKKEKKIFPYFMQTMDSTTSSHVEKAKLLLLLNIDASLDEENISEQYEAMRNLRIQHETIKLPIKKDILINDDMIMHLILSCKKPN